MDHEVIKAASVSASDFKRYMEDRAGVHGFVMVHRKLVNIVSYAAVCLYDNQFQTKLNSVPHLLGVKNGVVNLRNKELL